MKTFIITLTNCTEIYTETVEAKMFRLDGAGDGVDYVFMNEERKLVALFPRESVLSIAVSE